MDTERLFSQAVAAMQAGQPARAATLARQALASSPDNPRLLHLLGIALSQTGRAGEGRDLVRRSLALSPQAAAAYNLGNLESDLKNWDAAAEAYRLALRLAPQDTTPLANLARALQNLRKWDEALECHRRQLSLAPDDGAQVASHAHCLYLAGRLDEALAAADRAIALAPDLPGAWINRSNIHGALGHWDRAIADLEHGVGLAPDDPVTRFNLGSARIRVGDYAAGWPDYEYRLPPDQRQPMPDPGWLARMAGRHVLVFAEQGFGDTFQFCRYLPLLARAGAKVTFECQAPLLPLLNLAGLGCTPIARGQPRPAHDLAVPLVSLPGLFGTRGDTIPAETPYLRAPGERVDGWRRRLSGGGLKVGLNWQGSATYGLDHFRSIPLAGLDPLLRLAGVEFVALHRDPVADGRIRTFGAELDADGAFLDTAALMAGLDLVITSDTSTAHLAGALGRPVWVLLSAYPDWRWGIGGERSPWYPTMRLFRQDRLGDWTGLAARVADCLAAAGGSID